jgi:outer membrane protein assembly factor BamA
MLERVIYKLDDDLLLERVLDPARGVYVRLGKIGEGAGFGAGPAFRYNTTRFDFKTSAAGSLKQYFIGEASLRFPGTVGHNEYIRPRGPYVELYGRRRDFPQEDFFGLGPDSMESQRSNYAQRDTLGQVTAGFETRRLKTGVGVGYLEVAIGAGTDTRMPSSTDVFSPAEMPGVSDRPRFVVTQPFVEFATVDRAVNDRDGGIYRLSLTRYRDQDLDRYSFVRWDADVRHYFSFAKDTRTIALRAWSASAHSDAGQEVPFYMQPTLGGARSLRGYRTFRYRDRSAVLLQAEYRWRINEFISGALFYDTGAVGPTIDGLGRLEHNYGIGLRAGNRMGSAFRVDFAFGGREGNRVLIRFDDVF